MVKQWIGAMSMDEARKREQPCSRCCKSKKNTILTSDLREAIVDADIIVESVTAQGLRSVLLKIVELGLTLPSIVCTSKGIEQDSGFLLSEVITDVLGENYKSPIGCISGPSLAKEVNKKLPTSVIGASYDYDLMMQICELFSTPYFCVYPHNDLTGVFFGGAMKNIFSIICAISDKLGFGQNAKSALITFGLDEMHKLGEVKGCCLETLNGLSGLGDLCATCFSTSSRNYKFGALLVEGYTPDQAQQKLGMVVEGMYTCVSARHLAHTHGIDAPFIEAVYSIIYENIDPKKAIDSLLFSSVVKQESACCVDQE